MHEKGIINAEQDLSFIVRLNQKGFIENFDEFFNTVIGAPDSPTAVVAEFDQLAVMLIKAMQDRGIRVPDDVTVTGYNDDYIAELFNPSLTTVRIPVEDMITLACKTVMGFLAGTEVEHVSMEVENKLIVRQSTTKQ